MQRSIQLRLLEPHLDALQAAVFGQPGSEGAAYVLCRRMESADRLVLLVREIAPVAENDYLGRRFDGMSIRSDSYARVAKRAAAEQASVLFVHSHPRGVPDHSRQDDAEEPELMRFLGARAPGVPHGSAVLTDAGTVRARLWHGDGWVPIDHALVLGRRFRLFASATAAAPVPEFFDRQVRAFGGELQQLLSTLHVGVVGAGGTGSAVAEQLCRLGVGRLSIYDGDTLAASNLSRVYGSTAADVGKNKAGVLSDHLRAMGLPVEVEAIPHYVDVERVARTMRTCDVLFGCTDTEVPRAILMATMTRYLIPVIDLGVQIVSRDSVVQEICGRVTTCLPGEACLFCRERISPARIAQESRPPDERARLAAEGYAPELPGVEPAVVTFTTAVAAQAVTEFLHRFTGFMGPERVSTEVLLFLHASVVRRNRQAASAACGCTRTRYWGRGDAPGAFLGLMWGD